MPVRYCASSWRLIYPVPRNDAPCLCCSVAGAALHVPTHLAQVSSRKFPPHQLTSGRNHADKLLSSSWLNDPTQKSAKMAPKRIVLVEKSNSKPRAAKGYIRSTYDTLTSPENASVVRSITMFTVRPHCAPGSRAVWYHVAWYTGSLI